MVKDCAGLKDGKCTWLRNDKCKGARCSFYKTKEQEEASRSKASSRIASLEQSQQVYIADKYCSGKMLWLQGDN